MVKWEKSTLAGSILPSYNLKKEVSPEWFARVYAVKGLYTFLIGKRVEIGQPTPERFGWKKKGFKTASSAKTKALFWIKQKQYGN